MPPHFRGNLIAAARLAHLVLHDLVQPGHQGRTNHHEHGQLESQKIKDLSVNMMFSIFYLLTISALPPVVPLPLLPRTHQRNSISNELALVRRVRLPLRLYDTIFTDPRHRAKY